MTYRNRWTLVFALTLAIVPPPAGGVEARRPLVTSRALLAQLRAHGRAEATLRWSIPDALDGTSREQKGTLALEPPNRARLDAAGGESITLRADGGEWLQPGPRQLLRLSPAQAATALRWWGLLLGGEGLTEKQWGERKYVVQKRAPSGDVDRATVELDERWLPRTLEIEGPDGGTVRYSLSTWRFPKARGEAAFRLRAPAGWQVVELP